MLPILPIVLVYHILDHLRYSDRTQLITREWLQKQMRKRVHLHKWLSKVRMYSYLKVFDQTFSCCSWPRFCQVTLGLHRRTRNRHYRLTWKSAANDYFKNRCKGCGRKARARVFGWNICLDCRRNPRLPECFMVSVGEARSRGVPKRILDAVPWHGSIMGCRLRFWKDIQEKLV
jgi:hypothetical protein